MGPPTCCASKCFHTFAHCKFKKFPSDHARAMKWEVNLQRPNWTRKDFHRLCECHFTEDQFVLNPESGVRKLKNNAVPTVFKTHTPKYKSHWYGTEEPPASPDPESSNHSEGVKDVVPASLFANAVLEEPEDSMDAEDVKVNSLANKSPSSTVEGSKPDRIVSPQSQPQWKYWTELCQSQQEVLELKKELKKLKGTAVSSRIGDSPIVSQIKSLQGNKVRCFAVNASGLNYLCKKGIVLKPQAIDGESENSTDEVCEKGFLTDKVTPYKSRILLKPQAIDIDSENSTEEICEKDFISNKVAPYESSIEALKKRVSVLEAENLSLEGANSRLQAERNMAQFTAERLREEHSKLLKEFQNLENLNKQLSCDNAKLLETLTNGENSEDS